MITRAISCFVFVAASILVWPPVLSAQPTGHIQVKGEPGIQIFLDTLFQGETSVDVGGLVIQNVASGSHQLKALKKGFVPQEAKIVISPGKVFVYTLRPFVPKLQITERGEEKGDELTLKVGRLILQSLPVDSVIDIPALGITKAPKRKDEWIADGVPEGSYDVLVSRAGRTLRYKVSVKTSESRRVLFNFINQSVRDLTAEDEERQRKEVAEVEQRRREAALGEAGRFIGDWYGSSVRVRIRRTAEGALRVEHADGNASTQATTLPNEHARLSYQYSYTDKSGSIRRVNADLRPTSDGKMSMAVEEDGPGGREYSFYDLERR